MSEMSKELRFWATDDIVPADLQHLCNRVADSHDALLEILELAQQHLEYCGYGDSYERECANASELPEKIEAAIAEAKKK